MAEAVSDSFRLKWDDFQVNLVNHLKGSKGDTDFSDVTLVCEDGRQVEAHRMVLAAGSGFFNAVLREGFKEMKCECKNKTTHSPLGVFSPEIKCLST